MASQSEIQQAFRQSGVGRSPTNQDYSFYSAYPDAGKVEGDLRAGGGGRSGYQPSGQTGSSTTTTSPQNNDLAAVARQMLGLQQEANKPAIQSLQSQIPEIQQRYTQQRTGLESQKAPLQARYDAIIQELKGKEQQQVAQTQTQLSQEYGKRGIPLQSGAFQQDLLQKTQPIGQNFASLTAGAQFDKEQSLLDLASQISGLTTQQTEQERAVQNAIAQLQSGASQTGIQQALQQYQFGQNQQLQQAEQQRLVNQAAQELALKKLLYQQTTLPESLATVGKTKAETAKTLRDLRIQSGGGWE